MDKFPTILHHGEGDDTLLLLSITLVPIGAVLVMCLFGLLLASPQVRVLKSSGRRLLGKLVFALFLPCLIFTQLGDMLTLQDMFEWWFIPANQLINLALGCLLGYFLTRVCETPKRFVKAAIIMTGVGNVGNIPLALVNSVCRNLREPRQSRAFGSTAECRERGFAFISFAQWLGAMLVYTFVYHVMEPPEEFYEFVEGEGGRRRTEGEGDGGDGAESPMRNDGERRKRGETGSHNARENFSPSLSSPLLETEFPSLRETALSMPLMREAFLSRLFRQASFSPSPQKKEGEGMEGKIGARDLGENVSEKCESIGVQNLHHSMSGEKGNREKIDIKEAKEGSNSGRQKEWEPREEQDNGEEDEEREAQRSTSCDRLLCSVPEPRVVRKLRVVAERTPLKHLMQPPVFASMLAVFIGAQPWLKGMFFGEGAPLSFVSDSLSIMGRAMIPCIMLALGGNMLRGREGPSSSQLGTKTTIAICVCRLVLLPALGVGVVLLGEWAGAFPGSMNSIHSGNSVSSSINTAAGGLRGSGGMMTEAGSGLPSQMSGSDSTASHHFAAGLLIPPLLSNASTAAKPLLFNAAPSAFTQSNHSQESHIEQLRQEHQRAVQIRNVFKLVLLLQNTVPSSLLAGAMASLRGYAEREVSSLIFWQHALYPIFLVPFLFCYLSWIVLPS